MTEFFRCKSSPSKNFVNDEICANRLTKPSMFSECKGCLGHNERVVKRTRKRRAKPPETETLVQPVVEKKTRKPRVKKVTEAPETPLVKKTRKPRAKKVVETAGAPEKKTRKKRTVKTKAKKAKTKKTTAKKARK